MSTRHQAQAYNSAGYAQHQASSSRQHQTSSNRQQQRTVDRAVVIDEEETFEESAERERAAQFLESTEMLMWLANLRNESVPQTRHHYERVMAGFKPDKSFVEWEDYYEPTESDIERLKPRSSSSKSAAKTASKSSGASTPTVAGPSRTEGSGGVSKKRQSREGGQRKRRSGNGG